MTNLSNLSEMKEVARESLRLIAKIGDGHADDCEGRGVDCRCGYMAAYRAYTAYRELNHAKVCNALVESIKRIEELEKDKLRIDWLDKEFEFEQKDPEEPTTFRGEIDKEMAVAALPKGGQ